MNKKNELIDTTEQFEKFIDQYDAFVFDCDGVLWKGDLVFKKTKESLELLDKMGKKVFVMSNNNNVSRKKYSEKMKKKIGYSLDPDRIYTSSYTTAEYLKSIGFKKRAYVIGQSGIKEELDNAGIESFGYDLHNNKVYNDNTFAEEFKIDETIGAVVIGFCMNINFYKMAFANACIRYVPECLFIGTNPDQTFPTVKKNGKEFILPGTGSFLGAVTLAAEREPMIMGKPTTKGFDFMMKKYNLDKKRVVFFGDRLNTDIRMANNAKIDSVLVLTGISKNENLEKVDDMEKPRYVMKRFGLVHEKLKK